MPGWRWKMIVAVRKLLNGPRSGPGVTKAVGNRVLLYLRRCLRATSYVRFFSEIMGSFALGMAMLSVRRTR